MGWFSKSKTNKDSEIFLSEFPSWVAIHSAKLVDELQKEDKTGWAEILSDSSAKLRLTNCFIGAHTLYLSLGPEGGIVISLFGDKVLEESLSSLPDKAKAFFLLTHTMYEKDQLKGKDSISSSLGDFYKIKIDPLDACVAFATDQEVNNSEEFSGLIGGLLPILNRLQVEQLKWLKELTGRWSKAK
jgi:hypothetical protein